MAMVRCPKHGRVYDDAKDAGCPICLQEQAMPRAPGAKAKEPEPPAAGVSPRTILVLIVVFLVMVAGGFYWYTSKHNNAAQRAQETRDSLRALAAAPAGPDTTTFARPNDFTPVRRARALRAALEGFVRANRGMVLGWPEGSIDTTAGNRAAQRRAKALLAAQQKYQDHLAALTRGGTEFRYEPGVRLHDQMENVTNQLQAAVSVLKDVVHVDAMKARSERVRDFTAVAGYLNAAGTELSNLPR